MREQVVALDAGTVAAIEAWQQKADEIGTRRERPGGSQHSFEGTEQIQELLIARANSALRIE